MKSSTIPASAWALLALASSPRAGVLVVDAGGAGDYVDLQSAVDGALDGDTILVRRPPVASRRFGSLVIDGKGLVLQGDMLDPGRVGPIVVRNLAPDQRVELSHLHVHPSGYPVTPDPTAVGLTIEANEGLVWVHGCRVEGGTAPGVAGVVALLVRSSAATIVSDSLVEGGKGGEGLRGGGGLEAWEASLWVYGTEVAGGKGGDGPGELFGDGGEGGDGASLELSRLYAAKSLVRGGDGGDSYGMDSQGGDGLVVHADSAAVLLDTELRGGAPAKLSAGDPGLPLVGRATVVPGTAPVLESPRTALAGSDVTLHVTGEPGDTVRLLVSERVVARPQHGGRAAVHVGAPFRRVDVGRLPESGATTVRLTLPAVPAGGSTGLVLQTVHLRPGSGKIPSGPELLVALDEAYVPSCGGRIYVDADAPPGGDGSSWATAFQDLRTALGSVPECPGSATEVWVAEGTYRPDGPGGDRDRSFYVYSDTHVYGGFAGGETRLDERDPEAHPVILSGDLNGDDASGFANRGDNSAHVLQSGAVPFPTRDVRLDGLVVRGGYALTQGTDQVAFRGGGMVARMSGELLLVRCTFTDNHADQFGGGLSWDGDGLSVSHCRFVGNRTGGQGGGVYASAGGPVRVADTVVAGNESSGVGAGLALSAWAPGSSREVRSCVVYANRNGFAGAGISDVNVFDDPTWIEDTVAWGNVSVGDSSQEAQIRIRNDAGFVAYCCVQDLVGYGGPGNIGTDPLFVDPFGPDGVPGTADDDLRLGPGSPCVDAGSNSAAALDFADLDHDGDRTEPAPVDLAGEPRFQDDPAVIDTGEGTPPVIDVGAFERAP